MLEMILLMAASGASLLGLIVVVFEMRTARERKRGRPLPNLKGVNGVPLRERQAANRPLRSSWS